ncbi:MAG: SdpI family protein [bacterium]
MESKISLIISFLFVGLLEIGLSIPLILEKVPPNYLYGFRTKKTLSNKEIWYKANKYTGKDLLVIGLILLVGALILLIFRAKLSVLVIDYVGLVLILIPLLIVLVRGFRYLSKL